MTPDMGMTEAEFFIGVAVVLLGVVIIVGMKALIGGSPTPPSYLLPRPRKKPPSQWWIH